MKSDNTLSYAEMSDTWVFHPNGTLTWIEGRKQVKPGDLAGSWNTLGYRVVTYRRKQWKIHRMVYAYHHGYWPNIVDHINGDRGDNRIENLRDVTHQINTTNTNKVTGKSKYRGVSLLHGKPRAFVQAHGKREFLGYFGTEEQARDAYEKRRAELNPDLDIGGYYSLQSM